MSPVYNEIKRITGHSNPDRDERFGFALKNYMILSGSYPSSKVICTYSMLSPMRPLFLLPLLLTVLALYNNICVCPLFKMNIKRIMGYSNPDRD